MPEENNNIEILDNNQIQDFNVTEGSTLPPLPSASPSGLANDTSSFLPGRTFFLVVILIILVIILILMKLRKKDSDKKVTDIINQDVESEIDENISESPAPKSVTKTVSANVENKQGSSVKFNYSTPKNLDLCIKKFLEITKTK